MDSWLFIKRFLRNPGRIGAVYPSGRRLCRMMVRDLGLGEAAAVAELGPGTGVITREILRAKGETTKFFAVELDAAICAALRRQLPEVTVYNANANTLDQLAGAQGIAQLDAVISGLPWAAFPAMVQRSILRAVLRTLKPGGSFVTFAYLQGMPLPAGRRFRALLERKFATVELSPVVWRNLPPAVVYRCVKKAN